MYSNIDAERARSGYTREGLALELGVTPKTLRGYVGGEKAMPHTILVKMADLFGCTTDYLLGRTEARNH